MKSATVSLFYDKRRGHNSIKLLLTFERKQRMYATGFKVENDTWERLKNNADREKPDGKIKDEDFLNLWTELWNQPSRYNGRKPMGLVHIARGIVSGMGPNFTFEKFKEALDNYGKEEPANTSDLIGLIQAKAKSMKEGGHINTSNIYELVAKSLLRFVSTLTNDERLKMGLPGLQRRTNVKEPIPVSGLYFHHITKHFLTLYEEWMLTAGKAPQSAKKAPTGNSPTTVGMYCRHLRAVFNDAIEAGIITREQYPFGKKRYVIPAGNNIKKALTKDQILTLFDYECMPGMEQRGRDLWFFSYLCNGMNMADICKLRWKDINLKEETLSFIRQKTSRSRKGSQTKIRVILQAETVAILDRWGTKPKSPNAYVFPFLKDDMTAEQRLNTVKQVTKMTNKHIGRIAKAVGISFPVRTYEARHSFATILLQSGAPLAFISEALGHTYIKTTQRYFSSFDLGQAKSFLSALL